MLFLSTSFKSQQATNGTAFVERLRKFDIDGIELEYRINDVLFRQLKEALKQSELKVVSIHNYFPIPAGLPHSPGGGDLFLLSHPDKDERQQAIQMTTQSIKHARDLGAKALVLHCGRVEMDAEFDLLKHYWNNNQIHSDKVQEFIRSKCKERDQLKSKHLESLLLSLDRLIHVAEEQNILLGIENRYHYHELPGLEDFKILFSEFNGGPLGYWHDTGHAHANEILGIIPPGALLETCSDHLIGVHLHDANGLHDHLAPGTGSIDFGNLKPFIKKETLLVVELKPGTPDLNVAQGIRYIRKNVIC